MLISTSRSYPNGPSITKGHRIRGGGPVTIVHSLSMESLAIPSLHDALQDGKDLYLVSQGNRKSTLDTFLALTPQLGHLQCLGTHRNRFFITQDVPQLLTRSQMVKIMNKQHLKKENSSHHHFAWVRFGSLTVYFVDLARSCDALVQALQNPPDHDSIPTLSPLVTFFHSLWKGEARMVLVTKHGKSGLAHAARVFSSSSVATRNPPKGLNMQFQKQLGTLEVAIARVDRDERDTFFANLFMTPSQELTVTKIKAKQDPIQQEINSASSKDPIPLEPKPIDSIKVDEPSKQGASEDKILNVKTTVVIIEEEDYKENQGSGLPSPKPSHADKKNAPSKGPSSRHPFSPTCKMLNPSPLKKKAHVAKKKPLGISNKGN